MTDSGSETRGGKRQRLVEGARGLIHEQGVHRTTLAEVAERADVPLGNVYYYFKSKDQLVGAVLDSYKAEAGAMIRGFERHRSPQARLKALVQSWTEMRDAVARYGCPIGTLCSELDKIDDGRDRDAAEIMALIIDWAEGQFRLLGRRDARDLAVSLFAGVQGAAMLASNFRDPQIFTRQGRVLERWIDTLAAEAT